MDFLANYLNWHISTVDILRFTGQVYGTIFPYLSDMIFKGEVFEMIYFLKVISTLCLYRLNTLPMKSSLYIRNNGISKHPNLRRMSMSSLLKALTHLVTLVFTLKDRSECLKLTLKAPIATKSSAFLVC